MRLTASKITLSNPRRSDLSPVEIEALADTGALHLCIPDHVRIQLDLEKVADRSSQTLAVNPNSPNIPASLAQRI